MNPKTGDIFLDSDGWESEDGIQRTRFCLFEFHEGEEYGKGFIYSEGGMPTYYFWAKPEESMLVENIPDDILFSFQHGSNRFTAPDSLKTNDPIELIRNSDFKYVTQEEVGKARMMEGIMRIEEVRDNWSFILSMYPRITIKIMVLCLEGINVKIPPMVNGELGIQMMEIMMLFRKNFAVIDTMMRIEDSPEDD